MLIEIPSRRRPDWLFSTLVQLPQMLLGRVRDQEIMLILSTDSVSGAVMQLVEYLNDWAHIEVQMVSDDTSLPDKHQLALDWAGLRGQDTVMILHDDFFFPHKGFFQLLECYVKQEGYGAVAGVYPLAGWKGLQLPKDYQSCPEFLGRIADANNWHQVYLYPDAEEAPLADGVEHLFGPFMYRVEALQAIGGFPVGRYSRTSHREETDVTYRIKQAGYKLAVVKAAVALHFMTPTGGAADGRAQLMGRDEEAFQREVLHQR